MRKIAGKNGPYVTGRRNADGSTTTAVITVEGLYADLKKADPKVFCPAGYDVDTSEVSSVGGGAGLLTVNCIGYYSNAGGGTFSPIRTTFYVDMVAVSYPLRGHDHLKNVQYIIGMWLATEEAKRMQSDGTFYYVETEGGVENLHQINDAAALDFCRAYQAGIETYNRYYPIVQKISTWKNPPGLNRNGTSFKSGSPAFSPGMGTFDAPPITLSGYSADGFFKSKDSWQENADKTWNRTEEWTWTPNGSSSPHAWIYASASNS